MLQGAYSQTGTILFELAKAANRRGDVYPIWGTCLGFEQLMVLSVAPLDDTVLQQTMGPFRPFRVPLFAARTLNVTCQSRVTLSLQ